MNDYRFDSLSKLFTSNNKKLYIVGGTSRDLLLGRCYVDHDFVTDATPSEIKLFLKNADYTFERFGSIKLWIDGEEVDITTLREEGEYLDYRHPSYIRFVNDLYIDSCRRDFTINAIYLDKDYSVIDYHNGINDLKNKIIRFIGDPLTRIKEDPLRILRAERFKDILNFSIEEKTKLAMDENRYMLAKINPDKIVMEEKKRKQK